MYIEFAVPAITAYANGFADYWTRSPFIKAPSDRYAINALTTTYVRLVEAALVEYRAGTAALKEFWGTGATFKLGAMNRSVSHFEACISDMLRATNCFRRLRGDSQHDPLSLALRADKAAFATDTVWDRIRTMRNEVHQLDEMIVEENIVAGQVFALVAGGPETAHPTEPNQTIKTIDRLVIGEQEILFTELATWLEEMAAFAGKIAGQLPSSR